MGLEFLDNPYENEYDDDSDFEIERDEEWVIPVDVTLHANRQVLTGNYWSLSDEGSGSIEGDDEDDENFNPEDSFWDDDDDDEVDAEDMSGDSNDDIDHDDDNSNDDVDNHIYNPDYENYPEYAEVEDVYAEHGPGAYDFEDDNYLDEDDDLDYVTYPIDNPELPEQPEKIFTKNNDANNLNSNNSETTNSSASAESHDD